jgi:hypothetical protein
MISSSLVSSSDKGDDSMIRVWNAEWLWDGMVCCPNDLWRKADGHVHVGNKMAWGLYSTGSCMISTFRRRRRSVILYSPITCAANANVYTFTLLPQATHLLTDAIKDLANDKKNNNDNKDGGSDNRDNDSTRPLETFLEFLLGLAQLAWW